MEPLELLAATVAINHVAEKWNLTIPVPTGAIHLPLLNYPNDYLVSTITAIPVTICGKKLVKNGSNILLEDTKDGWRQPEDPSKARILGFILHAFDGVSIQDILVISITISFAYTFIQNPTLLSTKLAGILDENRELRGRVALLSESK